MNAWTKFFRPVRARMLRELVEVAAILVAGVWGLYIFVYENNIKPTLAPPAPSISIDMRHVGDDGGLAVIRVEETIHNPGVTEVDFLGHSMTVIGSRLTSLRRPIAAKPQPYENDLEGYAQPSGQVPVFREAFVTSLGDKRSGRGLFVEPGQTTTFSHEFYVPRARFSLLTVWIVAAYEKSAAYVPTSLTIEPSGLPKFQWPPNTPEYSIAAPLAELDLGGQ